MWRISVKVSIIWQNKYFFLTIYSFYFLNDGLFFLQWIWNDFLAYFPVAVIPKTARSVKISEKNLSSNYLAIRDIFGNYYLNGHQQVAWPGEYSLGGARFIYNRPYNEPETLESVGPLKEDLVLEVWNMNE